jgi:hypothetical protein
MLLLKPAKEGSNEMYKLLNRSLILIMILSCVVVFSVIFSSLPLTMAKEQTIQEKTLNTLNDVANINVNVYNSNLKSLKSDSFLTLPQRTVDYNLTSIQGTFRALCSFVDGDLHQIFISESKGKLSLNSKSTNTVDDAEAFMFRYQNYRNDGFYGNLQSMLSTVSVNQNYSKAEGNAKLNVTVLDSGRTEFCWTYIDENGIEALVKNVILSYQDGNFKSFTDNWQFYTIANENTISRDQAVNFALNASANFSYSTMNSSGSTVTISDFKVASVGTTTLCYLNYQSSASARGKDPFVLYPSWYIPIGFDKVYNDGLSGVNVRLWADNGKISTIAP